MLKKRKANTGSKRTDLAQQEAQNRIKAYVDSVCLSREGQFSCLRGEKEESSVIEELIRIMNKEKLIQQIRQRTGLAETVVEEVLSRALEEIGLCLGKGESVSLSGFGVFELHKNRNILREGRSGQTRWMSMVRRSELSHQEKRTVVFKAGKQLQIQVCEKKEEAKSLESSETLAYEQEGGCFDPY